MISTAQRVCLCGKDIAPTKKILEYGRKHGRDLSVWPTKCVACIVDAAIDMFMRVEDDVRAAPKPKTCVQCGSILGAKYWSDVPNVGDLCLKCHEPREKES